MTVQKAIAHLATVGESLQRDRTRHEERIQRLEGRMAFVYFGLAAQSILIIVLCVVLLKVVG